MSARRTVADGSQQLASTVVPVLNAVSVGAARRSVRPRRTPIARPRDDVTSVASSLSEQSADANSGIDPAEGLESGADHGPTERALAGIQDRLGLASASAQASQVALDVNDAFSR